MCKVKRINALVISIEERNLIKKKPHQIDTALSYSVIIEDEISHEVRNNISNIIYESPKNGYL